MAKLYLTNGEVRDIEPKSKREGFTLQELYDAIKCDLVEHVVFSDKECFLCDEEGWLKPNPIRNEKVNEYITSVCGDDWDVCGNVVVCKIEEFK